jgi:hypothetical protein
MLEWRKWALSTGILSGQEISTVWGLGLYRESSNGTSRRAGIWTPDNVRARPGNVQLNQTKFGRDSLDAEGLVQAGLDKVWLRLDKVRDGRTLSGETGHCPIEVLCFGIWSHLEFCLNDIFHFTLHTPLNNLVFLYWRDKWNDLEHAWALLLQVGTLQL